MAAIPPVHVDVHIRTLDDRDLWLSVKSALDSLRYAAPEATGPHLERIQTCVDEALAAVAPAGWDVVRALVNEQAEDEGIWFIAENASEGYLQQELRRLHEAIEVAFAGEGETVAEYLARQYRGGVTNDPAEDS